jgi:hypothetical protein
VLAVEAGDHAGDAGADVADVQAVPLLAEPAHRLVAAALGAALDRRRRKRDDITAAGQSPGSRDGQIPARWWPEIRVALGGDGGFAGALYHRWSAALTARLDAVLEARPADLPDAAAQAARLLARERPALFGLLSAYASHPVLAAARVREKDSLAWAPGAQLAALAPQPAAAPAA